MKFPKEFFKASAVFALLVLASCSRGEKDVSRTEATIGTEAPNFKLENSKKESFSLDRFRAKKNVLLVFWASWCPSCMQEIPSLKSIYKSLKDKVEILSVNVEQEITPEKADALKQSNSIPYEVLVDPSGQTAKSYNVMGIPKNVFIDKNGKIKFDIAGSIENLEELVQKSCKD
jgi:cytochrome c biogenesis protein CcmG, thiol:disulfide interchange protein DsbE